MSKSPPNSTDKAPKAPEKTRSRQRGMLSDLNRDATILGGLRSSLAHGKRSALSIQSGTNSILDASRRSLVDGRVETFDEATDRLGVPEGDLTLIHNQIVLQAYVSLVVALVAFGMALQYSAFSSQVAAIVLAIVIGFSAIFFAVQSSVQTMQIRRRELGLLNVWLVTPGDWFPGRLTELRRMSRSDPLRHPTVVQSLARKSRLQLMVAGAAIGAGIGMQAAKFGISGGAWPVLLYILAVVFLSMGVRLSFEVFRRRVGLHCDAFLWIQTPRDWIPSVHDPRTDDLLKFMKSSATAESTQSDEELPHG